MQPAAATVRVVDHPLVQHKLTLLRQLLRDEAEGSLMAALRASVSATPGSSAALQSAVIVRQLPPSMWLCSTTG